jgi:hypothetical protein
VGSSSFTPFLAAASIRDSARSILSSSTRDDPVFRPWALRKVQKWHQDARSSRGEVRPEGEDTRVDWTRRDEWEEIANRRKMKVLGRSW